MAMDMRDIISIQLNFPGRKEVAAKIKDQTEVSDWRIFSSNPNFIVSNAKLICGKKEKENELQHLQEKN